MVVMWCVTLCLTGFSVLQGCVTAGNLERIASNVVLGFLGSNVGLGDGT